MQRANRLIKDICDSDPGLRYIDIVPVMLNRAGELRGELFTHDGTHLDKRDYALSRKAIRTAVEDLAAKTPVRVSYRGMAVS